MHLLHLVVQYYVLGLILVVLLLVIAFVKGYKGNGKPPKTKNKDI